MDCRLDYLDKSKRFEDRLKELKSEIHALKLEEKQTGLYSHWNEVLGSLDRSLGHVCNLKYRLCSKVTAKLIHIMEVAHKYLVGSTEIPKIIVYVNVC